MTHAKNIKTGLLQKTDPSLVQKTAIPTPPTHSCPLCGHAVHVRSGGRRRAYFAHARVPNGAIRKCHARDKDFHNWLVEEYNASRDK
jgi:competence CoiA-like predicted nuclease